MKNLIDELNALNEEEFEVSASFSKNVMKKIKRKNNIITFAKVASGLSCACLAGFFVFAITKYNLFVSNDAMSIVSFSSGAVGDIKKENDESLEKETMRESSLEETINDGINKYDSAEINYAPTQNATIEKSMDVEEVPKTYSKKYDKKEYLNEISNILTEYNYNNTINEDDTITIENDDLFSIYNVLNNYVDIELEYSENKIILKLK